MIGYNAGNNGKPEIAPPHDKRGLRFNVSNSGRLALVAVHSGNAIDVEIEKVRPLPDLLDIARLSFLLAK